MSQVLMGSEESLEKLEALMHEHGVEETGLEEFIKDLKQTNEKQGAWWIFVDDRQVPRACITVRYHDNLSYLRSMWTRVSGREEAELASMMLLQAWISSEHEGIDNFQADVPSPSMLVDSFLKSGFQEEKSLVASYSLSTAWDAEDSDEWTLRQFKRDEANEIYHSLVSPDLDPESQIYITDSQFFEFVISLNQDQLESWVVVEDGDDNLVGFAASFVSIENQDQYTALMYGPHTFNEGVAKLIIAEMRSYWKAKGIDRLRILRTNQFSEDVIDRFNLNLTHQTIRFSRLC